MSYKENGAALTSLRLLPGSTFTRTKAGFDTGRRQFQIDRAYAWAKAPLIDSADTVYPGFYVASVDVTEGIGDIAMVDVQYLGLADLNKPPAITGDTNSEQFFQEGWTLNEATPSVTFVYVQSNRPDPWEPGQRRTPPGFGTPSYTIRDLYYGTILADLTITFQGWVLKSRNYRQAGPYWEVTDTYEYVRVRASTA